MWRVKGALAFILAPFDFAKKVSSGLADATKWLRSVHTDASNAVRILCLRLVRWVQCAFVRTRLRMNRCVNCARPGLNGWLRRESRRWRWCAAVKACVLPKFWHNTWHGLRCYWFYTPYCWTKLHKTCGGTLNKTSKWLVTCIRNKRKLPNLTLCNAAQIIQKVVLSTLQTNKALHYINFAWLVATMDWMRFVLAYLHSHDGIALNH